MAPRPSMPGGVSFLADRLSGVGNLFWVWAGNMHVGALFLYACASPGGGYWEAPGGNSGISVGGYLSDSLVFVSHKPYEPYPANRATHRTSI